MTHTYDSPPPKWAFTLIAGISFLLISATPGPANANSPLRWFGIDAKSGGMSGSGIVLGTGPGNLYLNPSLMSFSPDGAWVTVSAAVNDLYIEQEPRDPAFDVPDDIYDTTSGGWTIDRPLPTSLVADNRTDTEHLPSAYMLSLTVFGSVITENLKAGLSLGVPLPNLLNYSVWYNDEREQFFSNSLHFERFGEFDSVMALCPGVSYAPFEWLSLGFSLPIDLVLALESKLFLTDGAQWEYAYMNTSGAVTPVARPIVGLAFMTPIGLRFGLVYRGESYADVDVDVDLRIWNGEVQSAENGEVQSHFLQSHRFVLGYKPTEVSLGSAFVRGSISVELSATFERWSGYLDRHGNHWIHPSWSDDTTESGWDDNWEDPTFDNVVSFRWGTQFWVNKLTAIRAGAAFFPSPMPSQTGRYNYVDNHLIQYSLGAGFRFDINGQRITLDVAGQLWHMPSVTVNKDNFIKEDGGIVDEVPDDITDFDGNPLDMAGGIQSNNPGLPGYTFGGIVLNIMLMLGTEFN